MRIDYVRVYQRDDVHDGVGCDPSSHPTADYINKSALSPCLPNYGFTHIVKFSHANAYNNPNLTTWEQAGYSRPRNSQYDGC